MMFSYFLNISLEALQHNKHCLFSCRCFFSEASSVACNSLLEHLRMYIICEVVRVFVHGIVNLDSFIDTDEDISDSHLIHRKGTSLI
jgi:hypothetical protein